MSIESSPTSITVLTVPPLTVSVGDPFLMKVQVRISSGSPLSGIRVEARAVPVTGETVSGQDFITQQYGGQPISILNDAPEVDNSTRFATSDTAGVARFILYLGTGTSNLLQSLKFQARQSRQSRQSR